MRRVVLALLIVTLAACGGDDEDAAPADAPVESTDAVTVDMAGFAFSPRDVAVQVGQAVTWANGDDFAHTAQADDGEFDTGNVDAGATSDPVTFDEAGTYSYFCAIHNSMTGTITVAA